MLATTYEESIIKLVYIYEVGSTNNRNNFSYRHITPTKQCMYLLRQLDMINLPSRTTRIPMHHPIAFQTIGRRRHRRLISGRLHRLPEVEIGDTILDDWI
jgi:hypothetical protein